MRRIGFSTGAIAYADFKLALERLRGTSASVIELSALRIGELDPLLSAIDGLELRQFSFISVHAPSGLTPGNEPQVVEKLLGVTRRGWSVVVHPDSIHDVEIWRTLGQNLCVENMDKRKPVARTRNEIALWFERLPEASFCLDLAHARQIDPSMAEAYAMLRDFGSLLREIHLSEVNSACQHERISLGASFAYREIASMIPEEIPIILESVVPSEKIEEEIQAAQEALPLPPPKKGEAAKVRSVAPTLQPHP
jgi:hypothetical protein